MKNHFKFAYLFTLLFFSLVWSASAQGKSFVEIKVELKMPEYADWNGQDRLGVNIDAAWKPVNK